MNKLIYQKLDENDDHFFQIIYQKFDEHDRDFFKIIYQNYTETKYDIQYKDKLYYITDIICNIDYYEYLCKMDKYINNPNYFLIIISAYEHNYTYEFTDALKKYIDENFKIYYDIFNKVYSHNFIGYLLRNFEHPTLKKFYLEHVGDPEISHLKASKIMLDLLFELKSKDEENNKLKAKILKLEAERDMDIFEKEFNEI